MASQYLLLLVQHGFLKPNPDTRMDTALGDGVAPLGFAFVLQEHHINALQKAYDLNEQACIDLRRARQQAILGIEEGSIKPD